MTRIHLLDRQQLGVLMEGSAAVASRLEGHETSGTGLDWGERGDGEDGVKQGGGRSVAGLGGRTGAPVCGTWRYPHPFGPQQRAS